MSTNTPVTGPDPAAQAAAQAAAAERQRLAAEEAKRAADAATEAKGTGQEAVYSDKQGVLDRDTVARNDGDLMAGYDKYAQADGSITEADFEKLYAEIHGAADAPVPAMNDKELVLDYDQGRKVESTMNEVGHLTGEVDKTKEDVQKLDEQLAAELNAMGSVVTPEQKGQFEEKWKAQHNYAGAQENQQKAEAALNDLLSKPESQEAIKMGILAGKVDQNEASTLMLGLQKAAEGPHPEGVLAFTKSLLEDPRIAASTLVAPDLIPNIIAGPVAQATTSMAEEAAKAAVAAGQDPGQAMGAVYEKVSQELGSQVKAYEAHVDKAGEQAGGEGGSQGQALRDKRDGAKGIALTATGIGQIGLAIKAGDGPLLKRMLEGIAKGSEEWAKIGAGGAGLRRALVGVGLVAGTIGLKEAWDKKDYNAIFTQASFQAADIADVTTEVLGAVAKVKEGAEIASGAYKGAVAAEFAASVAEKMGGALTAVAGFVGAANDFNEALGTNSWAKAGAGAGNVLVGIGGIAILAGSGGLGIGLVAAGTVANVAFNVVNEKIKENQVKADLQLLAEPPIGLPQGAVDYIKEMKPEDPKRWTEDLHLTPEQFQKLLGEHPELIELRGDDLERYARFAKVNLGDGQGHADPGTTIDFLGGLGAQYPGKEAGREGVKDFNGFIKREGSYIAKDPQTTMGIKLTSGDAGRDYHGVTLKYIQAATRNRWALNSQGGGSGQK